MNGEEHSDGESVESRLGMKTSHSIDLPDVETFAMALPDSEAAGSKIYQRMTSHPRDELRQFRNSLHCLCLDLSTPVKAVFSWIMFIIFTFLVPITNFTSVSCPECDDQHRHPFERRVQVSETALAAISFLCLSHIVRKHGLRRTLLLDTIVRESDEVRHGYESALHSSFSQLGRILLPCLTIELVFRVWWYIYVSVSIPFIEDDPRLNIVLNVLLCAAGLLSWLYRTSVFLFTCILFRLMCSLQILRIKGYNNLLKDTPDVAVILAERMRIRAQMNIISHRFRLFLLLSLFTIFFSEMSSLFVLLSSAHKLNFFRAGDLVVCSVVQLTGLVLCLHGAAKITHRVQKTVGIVSHWHALATCNPRAVTQYTPPQEDHSLQRAPTLLGPGHPSLYHDSSDDLSSSEDESPRFSSDVEQTIYDLEAFQKRQALVMYLQHTHAGISLYGFVLDRGFLYGIFGLSFSLTLFILGKTIIT